MSDLLQITLARPHYRSGETVVGTVRFRKPPSSDKVSPRQWLSWLKFQAMGKRRLDPRWHPAPSSKRHEHQDDAEKDACTTWVWATPRVNLLELPERLDGNWEQVKPHPVTIAAWPAPSTTGSSLMKSRRLKDEQLAYSFQFDLPDDLPPTASCTSCRYYYQVTVSMQFQNETSPTVVTERFVVRSTGSEATSANDSSSSASIVAHAAGLPAYVSSKDLYQDPGTIRVAQNHHRPSCQTLRVADPSGQAVCLLTVLGASHVHPGSRVVLQLDLSRDWIPVHQVAACIEGLEVALHADSKKANRCRSYVWSAVHQAVDPECCNRLSLELLLSHDAPCTLATDVVEVRIQIVVDVCIRPTESFRNLRLEIPLTVTHMDHSVEEYDEGLARVVAYEQLVHPDSRMDTWQDQQRLAMCMAEQCRLVER